MIESITFYCNEKIIIITVQGQEAVEYTEAMKDQYLIDFPDRGDDVVAIGWV